MRHVDIKIFGEVQGTSFRAGAKQAAQDAGLAGFVENRPDGSVYTEAEGEDAAVEKFIAWCKEGSKYARVDRIEVTEGPMRGFAKFEIRQSGLFGTMFGE
jgi:acylphosphatase